MASGRPIYPITEGTQLATLTNRVDGLERRRPVSGHYEIKIFADDELVETGNGLFIFAIPFDLNRAKLRYVNAYITTVSSSGDVVLQIHNLGSPQDAAGFDMLDSPIQIDQGDLNAEDSGSPWEIDTGDTQYTWPDSNNTVFYRQQIRIDVDSAGSGAMGLGVMIGFD